MRKHGIFKILLGASILAIGALFILFLAVNATQEGRILSDEVRSNSNKSFVELSQGMTAYQFYQVKDAIGVILLIHGGGITGDYVWKHQIPALNKEGYSVLSYDLYGRGLSDRVKTDHSSDLFVEQINDLLSQFKIQNLDAIISMSMGSSIALKLLQTNRILSSKLVMIDPATTGDYKPNPLLRLPIISDFLMTLYWYPRAAENQRIEFSNQDLFNSYKEELQYYMSFEGYKRTNYSSWMNILQEDNQEILRSLTAIQAILIYGANDPYFPEILVSDYLELKPDLEVHRIEKAGHMPHFEKPDIVNPMILDFLTQK